MSRPVALGAGVLLACLYLVGAILSGRLDPLDRRPILDGLAPPPPYGWVSPPEALASTNQPPSPKTFRLSGSEASFDPSTGSAAIVFATGNYQATLALGDGAFPPAQGATGAVVTMTPLAPSSDMSLPDGYRIAGNVMHITASYQPTGQRITRLHGDAQLTLAYPIVFGVDDTIVTSADGRRWTSVHSTDHIGQQLVVGTVNSLGFFAVGQRSMAGGTLPSGSATGGGSIPILPIAVLIVVVVAAVVVVVAIRARSRESGPPRPPPRPRRDDPWRE
jgi:hypothetical protein